MNEKEKALVEFCRYYKGEKSCPFEDRERSMLWRIEMLWVKDSANGCNDVLTEQLSDYIQAGLSSFNPYDGTPVTYKAYLFNRYARSCYSRMDAKDGFMQFYNTFYSNERAV